MTQDYEVEPTRSRRSLLSGGLAAALGAAVGMVPGGLSAAPSRLIKITGGGIAGGGVAKLPDGDAHFSLLATRLVPESGDAAILGRIQWSDPGFAGKGVTFESISLAEYGPVPGVANARAMAGQMKVNGAGSYPFNLTAIDAGGPGAGSDTITLTVGTDTSDFSYTAVATVSAGDLELLTFDFSL